MNRAFFIIFRPVLVVAGGYVLFSGLWASRPVIRVSSLRWHSSLPQCIGLSRRNARNRHNPAITNRKQTMIISGNFQVDSGRGHTGGIALYLRAAHGCNLRCTWCDTAYAFHGGKKMSVEDVLARVDERPGAVKKVRTETAVRSWS